MAHINPLLDTRPLADLHLDPRNARRHPTRNLEAIKESLSTLGQQKPIVIDKSGKIIAGNGTFAAAQALGWDEIGVIEFDGDAKAARKFAIADNRAAELAEWDVSMLSAEMNALGELGGTGFTQDELRDMLGELPSAPTPTPDAPAGDPTASAGAPATLTHADSDVGKTPEDKLDTFMAAALRQVVLIYKAEDHTRVVAALEAVCKDQGLESNAAAVDWLLRQYLDAKGGAQ